METARYIYCSINIHATLLCFLMLNFILTRFCDLSVKKFEWFQKAVWMDQKHAYTKAELLNLAIEFITRNDEEIREAVKSASAGKPAGIGSE